MTEKRSRMLTFYLLPALILMTCIQFMPMLYNLVLSFLNIRLTDPNKAVQFMGLVNYLTILKDAAFWNAVKVTLMIAVSSVVLQIVLGLALAMLLDVQGRFGATYRSMSFFRGLLFIPYMIMPVMVGLSWFIFADSNYGMLNPIFQWLGIPTKVWFADRDTVVGAIIAMDTWQCTPMVMMILSAGLKTIDGSLYEAAKVDGANPWHKFLYVTLPCMTPVLKVAVSMRLMDVMRIYDTIIATTKGGPGTTSEVISIYVYKLAFKSFKTSQGATAALLITVLILAMSMIVVRFFSHEEKDA
jgi:multiple sugar transport system permease protein